MALRLTIIDRVRRPQSKSGVGVSEWKRGSRTGANGRWAAAAGTFVELAASALVEADGADGPDKTADVMGCRRGLPPPPFY